jgi:hypothetical protein
MLETLLKKSNQSKAIFAQRFTVPRFPLFYVEFCFILADIYNPLRVTFNILYSIQSGNGIDKSGKKVKKNEWVFIVSVS